MDHVKESSSIQELLILMNPLDDTNIMSLTVASGLEAINSVSFLFSNPADLMYHKITILISHD